MDMAIICRRSTSNKTEETQHSQPYKGTTSKNGAKSEDEDFRLNEHKQTEHEQKGRSNMAIETRTEWIE